ncbi:MAG: ribonuclease P protein component [Cyanobacteria bacterium P01_D01_bin.44]
MALPKRHRLRSPQAFTQVYRLGRRARGHCVAVKAFKLPKPSRGNDALLGPCFGISISRKVSKRAVIRNRIKRQIRAGLQQLLPRAAPGWHVVISVRSAAVECKYDEFLRELEQQLTALEVIDGHQ